METYLVGPPPAVLVPSPSQPCRTAHDPRRIFDLLVFSCVLASYSAVLGGVLRLNEDHLFPRQVFAAHLGSPFRFRERIHSRMFVCGVCCVAKNAAPASRDDATVAGGFIGRGQVAADGKRRRLFPARTPACSCTNRGRITNPGRGPRAVMMPTTPLNVALVIEIAADRRRALAPPGQVATRQLSAIP